MAQHNVAFEAVVYIHRDGDLCGVDGVFVVKSCGQPKTTTLTGAKGGGALCWTRQGLWWNGISGTCGYCSFLRGKWGLRGEILLTGRGCCFCCAIALIGVRMGEATC